MRSKLIVALAGALVLLAALLWFRAGATTVELGPTDGADLPSMDLERVAVGDPAPDFSLLAYAGDTVTLSDFRRRQNVVLVFYRGHW